MIGIWLSFISDIMNDVKRAFVSQSSKSSHTWQYSEAWIIFSPWRHKSPGHLFYWWWNVLLKSIERRKTQLLCFLDIFEELGTGCMQWVFHNVYFWSDASLQVQLETTANDYHLNRSLEATECTVVLSGPFVGLFLSSISSLLMQTSSFWVISLMSFLAK